VRAVNKFFENGRVGAHRMNTESRTKRLDQTSLQVTKIYRPARLATRAASFRYGGRHHSGIPGAIIPLYPGAFVVIRTQRILMFGVMLALATHPVRRLPSALQVQLSENIVNMRFCGR
jgi:hypothetical protein